VFTSDPNIWRDWGLSSSTTNKYASEQAHTYCFAVIISGFSIHISPSTSTSTGALHAGSKPGTKGFLWKKQVVFISGTTAAQQVKACN
jgi:hypothetical protein